MNCYKQKRRTLKDCYKHKSKTLMNCYKQKRRRLKDCYFLDSVIGEGGFGKVHDGVRIEDGARVAIKFVAKNKVTDWTTMSGTKVPMELMLLDRVQAVDGVIKLLEYFEEKNGFFTSWNTQNAKIYINILEIRELSTNTRHTTFSNRLLRLLWWSVTGWEFFTGTSSRKTFWLT